MSTKTLEQPHLKAVVAADQKTIEFYMLAFSPTPDKQGDIISPSAADDWLARFYAEGAPLPISFTHAAVRDSTDPFNIIGHAPADPQHVFKDAHGIRVVASIDVDTNPIAAQAYSLAKRGIVNRASVAYFTSQDGQRMMEDGSTLITKIDDVLECGPCLDPANEDAYVLAVKAMEASLKALDDSPWDGNRAMSEATTAAQYRQICAGEHTTGEPDQRQHWALPHHYVGRDANAAGVRAARARLPQTQDLKDREAVRAHLFETHTLPSDTSSKSFEAAQDIRDESVDRVLHGVAESIDLHRKAGRVISAANLAKLRAAQEVINELLAFGESEVVPEQKAMGTGQDPVRDTPQDLDPDAELRQRLAAFA